MRWRPAGGSTNTCRQRTGGGSWIGCSASSTASSTPTRTRRPGGGRGPTCPAACGLAEAGAGEMIARGVAFLLKAQRGDGGWGDGAGSIEESGLAVTALKTCGAASEAQERGRAWIKRAVNRGVEAAPIGFYFAKLW